MRGLLKMLILISFLAPAMLRLSIQLNKVLELATVIVDPESLKPSYALMLTSITGLF